MKRLMKKMVLLCIAGVLLTGMLAGCGGKKTEAIRVGTKDFTENLIVGEIYALALEDAGYEVERIFDIAGSVVHTSITNNEIDLYPEYTGTGLLTILQLPMITDAQQVYDTVKEEYKKKYDLVWLDYAQANDGEGIVIRTDVAEKLGISTLSDLQKHASEIRFVSQGDFDQREDGLMALEQVYGPFDWKSSTVYDGGLRYSVLSNNEGDAAPAYTTEGPLVKPEFTLLEDDKHVWPPYNLAPVVRQDLLDKYPDVADILNKISAGLDTETVTELNAAVDVDKREYEEVAKEYYDSLK
ncbi:MULTISPECIES: glycine betaine ABC transporter substrate-binding protein [Diplocloster]|uniref:Glycine/betaine ABC transporter substrate-binding protein n=1 Tax=Diplocloster modestus TaxID=2850322 RepID=A0ABS6K7U1_9FIRM|nr:MULTISPECIES: glycine betaine ABC transporter substrate-binding protein [Lachnospiraceae]MBU9726578.1 glycine/betaine ABC transporter substrate-binding protein [Diplocloster modestus]MBU9743213.1 glycine/betaine ABC transporter substrate-binding protein [Diplocloster agilis]MCU6735683.1 glycine/betaine ABC transporter substrate-binding protein [Suonthocola fibrivorans]SCJ79484.1 Osmoprotectant-binding protein [uncultured Clostridium sp.]